MDVILLVLTTADSDHVYKLFCYALQRKIIYANNIYRVSTMRKKFLRNQEWEKKNKNDNLVLTENYDTRIIYASNTEHKTQTTVVSLETCQAEHIRITPPRQLSHSEWPQIGCLQMSPNKFPEDSRKCSSKTAVDSYTAEISFSLPTKSCSS